MKLIIDIPENTYKEIKEYFDDRNYGPKSELAIANGTPLENIRIDVNRHKMDFYPSDYTLINTLIDKWINKGVDI